MGVTSSNPKQKGGDFSNVVVDVILHNKKITEQLDPEGLDQYEYITMLTDTVEYLVLHNVTINNIVAISATSAIKTSKGTHEENLKFLEQWQKDYRYATFFLLEGDDEFFKFLFEPYEVRRYYESSPDDNEEADENEDDDENYSENDYTDSEDEEPTAYYKPLEIDRYGIAPAAE